MFARREHANELPKDPAKQCFRVLRRKIRNGRLFSRDELQIGDQTHNEHCIRAQRLNKALSPPVQFGLAPAEQETDQALESLCQSGIRNVALMLVEFSRCKQSTRQNQLLMQLADDGGLADSRVSGDEHKLRPAACDDAVEGFEQGINLALASIQSFWQQQPIWPVVLAHRKCLDGNRVFPNRQGCAESRSRHQTPSGTAPRGFSQAVS